jgi:UDP-N-acetyl-D-galactosamine dehydrogenase
MSSRKLAVVGLGYVGLELAIQIAKLSPVIAYDHKSKRVEQLKQCLDVNYIASCESLKNANLIFTDQLSEIASADCYFVVVQTPVSNDGRPDLKPLINVSKDLGTVIKKNDIIIFESTVYPGTTDEICIKWLEELSGLKNNIDFFVAYSPERFNPGDSAHQASDITKILGCSNRDVQQEIQAIYQHFYHEVHLVSDIKTAEAVKILENIQRDINIACMNEFTKVMHHLQIDMDEVLTAAKTKWNFLSFYPGLVGGHCIPVDPLYLVHKAKMLNESTELIETARQVNDSMVDYVIKHLFEYLIQAKADFKQLKIAVLGLSYKANIYDLRNSLAIELVKKLNSYHLNLMVHDPFMTKDMPICEEMNCFSYNDIEAVDVIFLMVGHQFYKEKGLEDIQKKLKGIKLMMDINQVFDKNAYAVYKDIKIWKL